MRGHDEQQSGMFSYISADKRVPQDHPLRGIRRMTDAALQTMSPLFAQLYSRIGRPSIAPEKLLRALLLQAFYSVRSERLLMEQLDYNLLFRWFVGMNVDDAVWDVTVFTKNRDRLLEGEIAKVFFDQVLAQAAQQGLLSDEHFTVDGTLIEAWANRRSFHPKNPPPTTGSGSKGEVLLRDTHESKSDPESRLYKKSTAGEAELFGSRADGKPQRACGASVCDASGAQGRTRSGGSDGDAGGGKTEQQTPKRRNASGADPGRGQELPGRGIHQEAAGVAGGAAYCGVRKRDAVKQELAFAERAGRSGICHQPGETETGRKDIWVDEECGGSAKNKIARAAAGGLAVPVIRRRREFGAVGEIAPRVKNGKRQPIEDSRSKR